MARQSTSPDTRRREANISKEESGVVTWYVKTAATGGDNTSDGRSPSAAVATLQKAHDLASAGDRIIVFPGQLGDVALVTISKSVTIVGLGGMNGFRGATFLDMDGAGVEAMLVTGDDVTLVNFGVAGDDTADYALKVGTQAISPARFRAIDCKFEGVDTAGAANVILEGCADVRFDRCEFAWGVAGIRFDDNDNGRNTQIYIVDCYFHNLAVAHIGVVGASLVKNLNLIDCVHDRDEEGAAPTDFILLSDNANTGIITGCRFAHATNATGVLTIGTGIMWVANATEAGWSTARPA